LWGVCGYLDESFHFALDYELWLRMFWYAKSIIYLDFPLSYIYLHPDQKTNERNSEQIALEPFLAVMKNISLWGISPWGLFCERHRWNKWQGHGIDCYLPRKMDIPILVYPYSKTLACFLVKKWF
jgi:hypothetical protein